MYLISSGEYINQELAYEFGEIPPTFLPLQNKRLFKHQLSRIPKGESVFLSLPGSFEMNKKDLLDLEKDHVNLIFIPRNLTLGQSIVYALKLINNYNVGLKLIHGDTLFDNFNYALDTYLVSETNDNYKWDYSEKDDHLEFVYTGFFSFSDQVLLIDSIVENDYDFIKGIKSYAKQIKVSEEYTEKWFDFGHVNTYYRSKSYLTTERIFNNLEIKDRIVRKSSFNSLKMAAEVNWFRSLPSRLKVYTPQVLNYDKDAKKHFYEIEFISRSTLSEIFVFGKNELFVWKGILEACSKFLLDCYNEKPLEQIELKGIEELYGPKTYSRLEEFGRVTNFDLSKQICLNDELYPSLMDIAHETNSLIKPINPRNICISHGDFCFSNIFYDFRTQDIRVIDPRGLDARNNISLYGDFRYDIAKLAHSIIGLYDLLITDRFSLEEKDQYNYVFEVYTNNTIRAVQEHFISYRFNGMTLQELDTYPILVHLFLSMLPLHSDNQKRQKGFICVALSLYKKIKSDNYYSYGG